MSKGEANRRSPYQGLIPFGEQDAPFFFGREKEARLIAANLFASPLTLLYGASGVGKSSVLRAGVAHQLKSREDLLVVVFNSWQSEPINGLIQAISDQIKVADPPAWDRIASRMPSDSEIGLMDYLVTCADEIDRRMMIILDQFEEYFLYHPLDVEFASAFSRAITTPDLPVSFLISIREDFYAKLDRFEGRIPSLYDNYLRIEHLNRAAARTAIEKPIAEYNERYSTNGKFTLEPELVTTVLRQVETGQVIIGAAGRGVIEAPKQEDSEARIETPFLQLVMTRLWYAELAAGSHKLRLETLNRLGGAANIVRTHLDAVISKLTSEEQEVAASIFHYLVTPSGTKIAYTASDLAGSAELNESRVVRVLEKLSQGDVRILRPIDPSPERPGAPRYEIFHDVLAPAILDWRARYTQAEERAETDRKLALEAHQRAIAEKQLARERSLAGRLRWALVMLAVLLVLMAGITVWANRQKNRADAHSHLATEAKREADGERDRARQLLAEVQAAKDQADRQKQQADAARDDANLARNAAEASARRAEEQRQIADEAKGTAANAAAIEKKTRLGLTEIRAGRNEEGIIFLQDANRGYENSGDFSGQIFLLGSIGEGYATLGAIPPSLRIDLNEELEDPRETPFAAASRGLAEAGAVVGKKSVADYKTSAATSYENALLIIERNKQLQAKNKELALHRLGDIYAHISVGGPRTQETKNNLRKAAGYYFRASEAYADAGRPLEQARTLRSAARLLASALTDSKGDFAGSETELKQIAEYYRNAGEAYTNAGRDLKKAAMLSRIGELYLKAPKTVEKSMEEAIKNYVLAATIYRDNETHAVEAILDSKIADVYKDLNRNDDAASFYGLAFKAYRKRDAKKKLSDEANESLKNIAALYSDPDEKKNEDEKQKADRYFTSFVDSIPDPQQKAEILSKLSRIYYWFQTSNYFYASTTSHSSFWSLPREKQDKARAIMYLNKELEVWKGVKDPLEETRVGLAISILRQEPLKWSVRQFDFSLNPYEEFDEAIKRYKDISEKNPRRYELADSLYTAARYLYEEKQAVRAAQAYEEVLNLMLERGTSLYTSLYSVKSVSIVLGKIYLDQNQVTDAERVFQKVLDAYAKDEAGKASALAEIGDVYAIEAKNEKKSATELIDYRKKAENYLEQSISVQIDFFPRAAQRKDEVLRQTRAAIKKLTNLHRQGAQTQESRLIAFAETATQATELLKATVAREALAEVYVDLGNNIDNALEAYKLARLGYVQLGEKTSVARVLRAMSVHYKGKGDLETSKQLADEAEKILKQP